MSTINKVILIGYVNSDISFKELSNQGSVAHFILETFETWKDKASGEKKRKYEKHKVVVYDQLANFCQQYIQKEHKLYVEGCLQTRKYIDKEGVEKYITEVIVKGYGGVLRIMNDLKPKPSNTSPQIATDDIPF